MSHQLRTRDGSEYLIQHDSEAIISTWHSAITQGIQERVGRAGAAGAGGEGMASHYAGQLPTVGGALHLGTGSSMTLVGK